LSPAIAAAFSGNCQWIDREDDAAGLGGPVEERSFFNVARRDFENHLAVNFDVRLEGKLIGEAVAKCFKKNQASYQTLSSCMRKNGEDETFFYFEKLV